MEPASTCEVFEVQHSVVLSVDQAPHTSKSATVPVLFYSLDQLLQGDFSLEPFRLYIVSYVMM